jgi:hypothetical protein
MFKLKSLTIKNAFYYLQSIYYNYIRKEYSRIFTKDRIDDMLYKTAMCPECYKNGDCLECGCSFVDMIKTNKHCPNGKF